MHCPRTSLKILPLGSDAFIPLLLLHSGAVLEAVFHECLVFAIVAAWVSLSDSKRFSFMVILTLARIRSSRSDEWGEWGHIMMPLFYLPLTFWIDSEHWGAPKKTLMEVSYAHRSTANAKGHLWKRTSTGASESGRSSGRSVWGGAVF